MIQVGVVYDVGYQGLVYTLGLNYHDIITIKEYKHSGDGCLITVCYFWNTSPSSILNFVNYWMVILLWMEYIQLNQESTYI